jgi:hypothetical protein
MDNVTEKVCSCGKEQQRTAVATETGKERVEIIDPVNTELDRPRETEKGGKEEDGDVNMLEE